MGQPRLFVVLGALLVANHVAAGPVPDRPIVRLMSREVAQSGVVGSAHKRREVSTKPLVIEDELGDIEIGEMPAAPVPPQYIARIEHTDMTVEMQVQNSP